MTWPALIKAEREGRHKRAAKVTLGRPAYRYEAAALHPEALRRFMVRLADDPAMQHFAVLGYTSFTADGQDSDWAECARVLVDEAGDVVAYMGVEFGRWNERANGLALANTAPAHVFGPHAKRFVLDVFRHYGMRTLAWSCTADNPARPMYERLMTVTGGRKVGVARDRFRLRNGTFQDGHLFEIHRTDLVDRGLI